MNIRTRTRTKEFANRGKYAEGKVREFLEWLNSGYARFDYERIYDARSARGRFPARPGDYAFWAPGLHGLIEVKQVDHEFRLPSKNLTGDQIAKLRKRELCGGLVFVLVYHTPTQLWRHVWLMWLQQRLAQPSWDLREFEAKSSVRSVLLPLQEALEKACQ